MTRYTRYKRLQSWQSAASLAVFATLLAFSSHSFSQNLVTNPGFESGTTGWTLAQSASAQFTEPSGRSGNRLTHWSSATSYTAETTQTVSGLTAGTYRLSLYTVGGATTSASLWATCGGQSFSTPIPSSPWGSWAQVVVDNISVSGSSCDLGITTQNSEWSSFDDVVFEKVADPGSAITVRASGTSGAESVSLQVSGTTVQTWTLTTSMQNYDATTELDGEIRVAFTNDSSGRDVRVDYIQVNGGTRQAEDQSTNTGLWANGACGGGSHSEVMHCNGYISFGNVFEIEPSEIVIEEGTGFCSVDGSVDSNHSGYTGSGFANTDNTTGAGVDWKVKVPADGNYILEWRYANGGSASRPGSVLVNGSSSLASVDFPVTGAWTSWTSASANLALSAGENTIRLQATTSAGLGNIDSLTVTGNSPQAVACRDFNGSAGCGSAPGLSSGRHSITVNGLHREYILHVPSNYNVNNPYQLVFDWHALNQSAQQIAGGWDNSGSLVERSNGSAIFVAPDRYVSPTGEDDAGWPNKNGRDMDFLRAMIDQFNSSFCIDQDQLFSVGFSYGGMMSLAVGREMGHVFRAIAPMAGGFMTPHNNLGLPMAIWIAAGRDDSLYSRGVEAKDYFVSVNGCSSSTVPVDPWPCVEYQGCGEHPVVWCSWDGPHRTPPFAGEGIWGFFSRF